MSKVIDQTDRRYSNLLETIASIQVGVLADFSCFVLSVRLVSVVSSSRVLFISVPRVRRSTSMHFLSPDQQSAIHCLGLIIYAIQLLTRNNLGGNWRRICSPDIRNVNTLEVLRNRALQIDVYLLTYLLTYLRSAASSATEPASRVAIATYDSAKGHTTVTSQVSGLWPVTARAPARARERDRPSGRLPSERLWPWGSFKT